MVNISAKGTADWLEQARSTLAAANDSMALGFFEEAISNAFLAMLHAARAGLCDAGRELADWRDVVRGFQSEDLERLGMSNASRRSLAIIAQLYANVIETRDMEADPLTAAACLEDAREFVSELGRILERG